MQFGWKKRNYGNSKPGLLNIESAFCTNFNSQYLSNHLALSAQILADNIFARRENICQSQKKLNDPHDPILCEYVSVLRGSARKCVDKIYVTDQNKIFRTTA